VEKFAFLFSRFSSQTGWLICFFGWRFTADGMDWVEFLIFCIQGADVYDSQMVTRERLGVQYL
jgi:hypothetical protein